MRAFVILSAVPYKEEKMKQRPQHIADYLAYRGYDTIYINVSTAKKIGLDEFKSLNEDFKHCGYVERLQENLYILDRFAGIECNVEIDYNKYTFSKLLLRIQETYGSDNVIFWCEHPICLDVLDDLDEKSIILYDCIDDWTEFTYDVEWCDPNVVLKERKLASISKVVVASAKKLFAKMKPYNENIYYLPNGVNAKNYIIEKNIVPYDLKNIPEPRVLFMGAIAGWVDIELIDFICRSKPNYSFIFLGNIFKEKLPEYDNVFYLGIKDYYILKYYTNNVNVAIITFKNNRLTASVSPLKFFEYISAGLPVITTTLPELVGKFGAIMAESYNDFLWKLDSTINMNEDEKLKYKKKLKVESSKYDWSSLLDGIINYLNDGTKDYSNKGFLESCIQHYKSFQDNYVIKNEMITLYNLLDKYTEAVKIAEQLLQKNQGVVDYEQVALAYLKIGDEQKSIYFINKLFNGCTRYSYYKSYLNHILSRNDKAILLEIMLYKLCGRTYDALRILDSYIKNCENDSFLYFMLASLYIDLYEYEYAQSLITNTIELALEKNQKIMFEPYSIDYYIDFLIIKKAYNAAEEIMESLYEMGFGEISDNKWAFFYFMKNYESTSSY